MSKQIELILAIHLNKFHAELTLAKARADAANTHDTTLGQSNDIHLLAAIQMDSIDDAVNSAIVVKRMKRAALIQIGILLYMANKWGVTICLVPADVPIGQFNAVWGPHLSYRVQDKIFAKLGVEKSWSGKDYMADYSNCPETKVQWMENWENFIIVNPAA